MKFDEGETDEVIDQLVKAERDAYIAMKKAEEDHQKAKEALCVEIEARGSTWVPWRGQKVTSVRSERVKVDKDKLRVLVGPEVWSEVTEERVVTEKVRQAILNGRIAPEVVDLAMTITTNAPYARFGNLDDE